MDWVRSPVTIGPDGRGPITMRSVPVVQLSSVGGPSDTVRLVWQRDGSEVARQTLPPLDDGALLTLDGRTDIISVEAAGDAETVYTETTGARLSDLDIGRDDWTLYVDQPADAAVRLLVRVLLVPVGVR